MWVGLTTPYSSRAYLFIHDDDNFRMGCKRYTNGGRGIIDPVPPPPGSASGSFLDAGVFYFSYR